MQKMDGCTDIEILLKSMKPELCEDEYVFTTISKQQIMPDATHAIGMFREREGTTFIFPKQHLPPSITNILGNFRLISLTVHSSLQSVGLTAAITKALADENICANVVAAFYHDHIFVPSDKADLAMATLTHLSKQKYM